MSNPSDERLSNQDVEAALKRGEDVPLNIWRIVGRQFTVTLKREWEMIALIGCRVLVEPGTYVVERTENPFGKPGYWLVIMSLGVGMDEGAWRQRINDSDDSQIIFHN